MPARKPYRSDVSDDEWALVAPYLTLLPEAAGQREHALREVFNGLRYVIETGAPWRWMLNELPPWAADYQQARAGGQPTASKLWPRICGLCCGWPLVTKYSQALPSWTAALCGSHRGAAPGRAIGRRQARLRAAAAAPGGRAVLRLGHTLSPAGEELRRLRQHPRRPAPRRLRLPHVQTGRPTNNRSITAYRGNCSTRPSACWPPASPPSAIGTLEARPTG